MGNISTPLRPRPTIYKGIEMRSRLEAWWAQQWDLGGIAWEYEPCAFANQHGQYLPDFRITFPRPGGRARVLYVDTKGHVPNPDPLLRRMSIIWSSEPEVSLVMIEGHGERSWLGFIQDDGSSYWMEHDGAMSIFQGPEAA